MYGFNYSLLYALSTLNLICQWISPSFHFAVPPGNLQFFLSLTSLNNFVISAYFRTLRITQTSVFIKLTLTKSGLSHAETSVYFLSVPNNIHDNTLHFKIIWCSHKHLLRAISLIFEKIFDKESPLTIFWLLLLRKFDKRGKIFRYKRIPVCHRNTYPLMLLSVFGSTFHLYL